MVYLYPLISILLLLYALKNKEKWGLTIPILYICAFMCIFIPIFYYHPQFKFSTHYGQITFWALIYWFFCFVLSLYPLRNISIDLSDIIPFDIKKINTIAWISIIVSVFAIFCYFPHISNGLNAAEFELNKAAAMDGELQITDVRILRSIINIHSSLRPIITFLFFYYLAYVDNNKLIKFLLGISAVVPVIFMTLAKCVRVDTAFLFVQLFILYFIYKDRFSENVRYRIQKIGVITGIAVAFMMVAFSVMRFSSGNWDWDPLFYIYSYICEGILNFNTLLFDHLNITTDGNMEFPLIKQYLGLDYCASAAEYKDSYIFKLDYTQWFFMTYIGDLCRDLNFSGTIIYLFILGLVVRKVILNIGYNSFVGQFLIFLYLDFVGTGLFYNRYNYYHGNLFLQNILMFIIMIAIYFKTKSIRKNY